MAYVALKQQPGPGGIVRQPGDHMPEADAWLNPKLWVQKGHVRWVPNADIVNGRWRDFDEFAKSGAGGRALKELVLAGQVPASPADVRPVHRLPPQDEYLRFAASLGMPVDGYEAFVRAQTAKAAAEGFRVEVKPASPEELAALERVAAARAAKVAEESEPAPVADEQPPTPPAQPEAHAQVEAAKLAPLPSRKELEAMSPADLLALAQARGLGVDASTGKGKLIKLLSKA